MLVFGEFELRTRKRIAPLNLHPFTNSNSKSNLLRRPDRTPESAINKKNKETSSASQPDRLERSERDHSGANENQPQRT